MESGDAAADRVAVPPAQVAPGEVVSHLSGEDNNNKSPNGVRDETPGSLGDEVLATDINDAALKLNQCNEEMPALNPDLPEKRLSAQGMEVESQTPSPDFPSASSISGSPSS